MSKVPARKKAQVIVAMLVVTAILIELGVTFGASSSYTFKKGIAEYPDDPRGYFDVIRNENGVDVYVDSEVWNIQQTHKDRHHTHQSAQTKEEDFHFNIYQKLLDFIFN